MPARKTEIQFEKVWRYHPHTLRNQKADYWTTIAFKLKISLKWRNPQVIFSVVEPDCRVSPMRFLLRASTYAADSSSLTDLLSTDLCLQSCVSARERSASAHHHPGGGEKCSACFYVAFFLSCDISFGVCHEKRQLTELDHMQSDSGNYISEQSTCK